MDGCNGADGRRRKNPQTPIIPCAEENYIYRELVAIDRSENDIELPQLGRGRPLDVWVNKSMELFGR